MRKMNYWIGALALALGIFIGSIGVSLASSGSPLSFISKLGGQDNLQTVSTSQSAVTSALYGDALSPTNDGSTLDPADPSGQIPTNANESELLKQQIITEYKQDIGTFFGAWRSADIDTFRQKVAKAYTGVLLEKHVLRAQEFLVQGIGLDVSQITFDLVNVESADANTATLRGDYRYTAKDYSLTDGVPIGEAHEQTVHVRVNLLKLNSHWLITGETIIGKE